MVESPVNAPDFDVDDLIAQVVDQVGPGDVVGIGAFVWNEAVVRRLLGALSEVRVVLGGAQVSFAPQGTLESTYPGAWAFVRGHGELGMVELAWGREPSRRSGVHFAGTTDRGARAELELGALPSPHLDGTLAIGPFVRWETQRGCPYACTFCQHREVGRKLRDRWLGQERLEAELAAFASAGVRRIAVLDPIFHANERRAVELLRAAKRVGLAATLSLQCRAELLGDAFLDALDGLSVELELGLQTVHPDEARAVGRPQDVH